MRCSAYLATEALTGHSNGLIGQTARTGVRPSQPTCRRMLCAYSADRGSNVHAVSVPNSVGTPSSRSRVRDSSFRVITSEFLQYRLHIFAHNGSKGQASAPSPPESLFWSSTKALVSHIRVGPC